MRVNWWEIYAKFQYVLWAVIAIAIAWIAVTLGLGLVSLIKWAASFG